MFKLFLFVSLFSALHHNNCMFVAHHLMTLDKTFRNKLSASSHPAARDASLDDLVPKVRRLGNDSFSEHIDIKKEQLCDHLCVASGNEPIGNVSYHLSNTGIIPGRMLFVLPPSDKLKHDVCRRKT